MATSYAEEVKENFESTSFEAELLMRDIVLRDQKPTYAETVVFRKEMGWDEKEVRTQLRRIHGVLRLQAVTGSPANREASEQEAVTAAAAYEKEAPKLDEQIAKLQAKKDGLERDARLSAKRCEEQRQAVQQLRELVPKHIGDAVNHAVSAIQNTIGRDILDIEVRIHELECCLDPSRYKEQAAYIETLQSSFRDAITVSVSNCTMKKSFSPEWPGIRSGIENELAELKERIEPMKAQLAELTEQAELPLAFYADPKNWENE